MIPIKIPMLFFTGLEHIILTFFKEPQKLSVIKAILRKKSQLKITLHSEEAHQQNGKAS